MLKEDREVPETPAKHNRKGIPLLPFDTFAGSGSDIEGINFDIIEERYEIPLFDGMQVDFLIPVRGSSMYPKYSSGDVVACRLIDELLFVQWNKVYVLDTISQGVIMKRLKKGKTDDVLICKSDNEKYDPFEIPLNDIRKIALVIGVIRLE
ncbi:Peptidase S24-like [Candidatus Ornithobacterium hominis]|uniref:S24 family peptidase n=1 Tax=Candidatus Ornithobacterium hominis TaxID=2497989 RepID=UPI000E5A338F|nr:S24 family peptidase [Candidatus Ornithobacterium hominis]SZD73660.1 Peptidase S24-like [Candidatus Ornithobacterium hominis]